MEREELLKKINELLEEEKWSKFQLIEYNVKKFLLIDELLKEIKDEETKEEIKKINEEAYQKNERNMSALYIIAVLSYPEDKSWFYRGFERLIDYFKRREKWGLVEHLAKKMMEFEENEFAIQTLIETAKFLGKSQEIPALQEKLFAFQPENGELAFTIAKRKQKEGKVDEAIKYYNEALKIYIRHRNTKMVEEIWLQLLELAPDNIDLFISYDSALTTGFNADFIASLYSLLITPQLQKKNYDTAIKILKLILNHLPHNREYRDELVRVLKMKYKNHSRIDDILISSGVRMWWKDINESLNLFEKQIKFDIGKHVYHYSWGTGKIIDMTKDEIVIDFPTDHEHKMTFDMGVSTLEILPEHHFKIKKRYNLDEIKDLVWKEPVKIVEMIIKSYPENEISLEILKEELVPEVLKPTEWQRWWNRTKKELRTTTNFKFLDTEKKITYVESDQSFGEIILNQFNKTEDFFEKIKVVNELIDNDISRKVDVKVYQKMADWFIEQLDKHISVRPQIAYIAFMVINKIKEAHPDVSVASLKLQLRDILNSVKNIAELVKKIDILEYQKLLIKDIVENREDWTEILYSIMFFEIPRLYDYTIEFFINKNKPEIIKRLIEESIEKYRSYPELFYFVARNILKGEWNQYIEDLNEKTREVLERCFVLLSYLGRQIKNKSKSQKQDKLMKQIIRLLFDKTTNYFVNYVLEAVKREEDIETLLRLFKENEYIPRKQKENIIAQLQEAEKPVVI